MFSVMIWLRFIRSQSRAGCSMDESIVEIDKWFGRFSNNLIQLVNAICIARKLGYSYVEYPESKFFTGNRIMVSGHKNDFLKKRIVDRFFTFADVAKYMEERPSYDEMRSVTREFINKLLVADIWGGAYENVTVHLRGGDVFGRRPQPRYVPGPVGFFSHYVEEYGGAGLVYEDLKHPAAKVLLSKSSCCDLSTKDMFRDLGALARSEVVVAGPGTYWFSAFLLNDRLRKIVVTVPPHQDGGFHDVWSLDGWPTDFEIVKNYLHGYICAGQWKNSFFQRRKIVSYDFKLNAEIVSSAS